jgi:hypothetical protein
LLCGTAPDHADGVSGGVCMLSAYEKCENRTLHAIRFTHHHSPHDTQVSEIVNVDKERKL